MQAARRLYLYLMSGITLAVIATGLVLLLRVALDGFFPDPFEGDGGSYDNSREQLSQAIAMLGVGTPVWAVHWWLVQRGLRAGRPERDAERGSEIRAIYITGIMLISLLIWVPNAVSLLQWLTGSLLKVLPEFSYIDPLGAATAGLAGFVIWLYHGLVRRRDLASGPVAGPAAWIPRLYLYGVAVAALFTALATVDSIVTSLLVPDDFGFESGYTSYYLIQQVLTAIAWALVWLGHWWYAGRLTSHADWRGVEERVSRTRVSAFLVVIVGTFIAALGDVAEAGASAIRQVFPVEVGANTPARFVVASLITTIPWLVAWYWHVRALRREPAAADPLRALHQERLVSHAIAAAGLAMGAAGAGWFLGLGLEVLLGGQRTASDPEALRFQISQWLPIAVLGLAVWLWSWRRVVARRRADPAGEANSTIRRTFLYLTLGVALIAALAAAVVILYRFVGLVIDASVPDSLASELSTPLGVLVAAGVVLVYHGLALRTDQRLVATTVTATPDASPPVTNGTGDGPALSAEGSPPSPAAVTSEAVVVAVRRRALALVGPEDELDAALQAARAALPPGIEIVDDAS